MTGPELLFITEFDCIIFLLNGIYAGYFFTYGKMQLFVWLDASRPIEWLHKLMGCIAPIQKCIRKFLSQKFDSENFLSLHQWFPKSADHQWSARFAQVVIQLMFKSICILFFEEHLHILSGPRTKNVWEPLVYIINRQV